MALNLVKDYGIIGICSTYQSNLNQNAFVKDLNIKDIDKALKIVDLDASIKDKVVKDLTLSEQFKIELTTKLHDKTIIIGNLSNTLNYKTQEYMKKLFIKLNSDYNKNIIVIDNDIQVFFDLVKRIYVIFDRIVVYETSDFFDKELFKWVRIPKIIDFINYVNTNQPILQKTTDINELIKDIYRSVT